MRLEAPRVVIDTSSLVSYVLTRGSIMQQIVEAWVNEQIVVLFSPITREELFSVLRRPVILHKATIAYEWMVENIDDLTLLVPGKQSVTGVCCDPKDEIFLACAVEGQAHYLITSDKDLLVLGQYEGVCILNPGQFLIALELWTATPGEITRRYNQETVQAILASVCLEPTTREKVTQAAGLGM